MPKYTVQDTLSKKTVTFDWNDASEPTDTDFEEVFKSAGLREQPQVRPTPRQQLKPTSLDRALTDVNQRFSNPSGEPNVWNTAIGGIQKIVGAFDKPTTRGLFQDPLGRIAETFGREGEVAVGLAQLLSSPLAPIFNAIPGTETLDKTLDWGVKQNPLYQMGDAFAKSKQIPELTQTVTDLNKLGAYTAMGVGIAKGGGKFLENPAKTSATPIRNIANKITPEPIKGISDITGLSIMNEADVGAIKRMMREKTPLSNKYPEAPQNYEKTVSRLKNTIDKEYTPRIENLDKQGKGIAKSVVEAEALDYLKKNSPQLNLPTGAKYEVELARIKKDFNKSNPNFIKASDMQTQKVATHSTANYEEMGRLEQEFNKSVANIYRRNLENWDKGLKPLNQKIYELGAIGDAQMKLGDKNAPSGNTFSGLPFYIAVTRSVGAGEALGATRHIGKYINRPDIKVTRMYMYNKLRNLGLLNEEPK
jgi:hypothetical protein